MKDLSEEKVILFNIADNQFIKIDLPAELKETHRFDDINIICSYKKNELMLFENDYVSEAVTSLNNSLGLALEGKIPFPENLDWDRGIYYYSLISMNNLNNNVPKTIDPSEKVAWVWSSTKNKEPQTFIYTIGDDVYLEISPNYKWLNREPFEGEDFIPFEEFIINYQMIHRFKLSKNSVNEWKSICESVLKTLIH